MSGLQQTAICPRKSVLETFGEAQIAPVGEYVVVDLQNRNDVTSGGLHCDHARAQLPLGRRTKRRPGVRVNAPLSGGNPRGGRAV
jgi:hypothetical protein